MWRQARNGQLVEGKGSVRLAQGRGWQGWRMEGKGEARLAEGRVWVGWRQAGNGQAGDRRGMEKTG